jgi:hypothetical protein
VPSDSYRANAGSRWHRPATRAKIIGMTDDEQADAGASEQAHYARVRELLGDRLLRYVLNVDQRASLERDALSGTGRLATATLLVELVGSGTFMPDDDQARRFDVPRILGTRLPPSDLTLANMLRVQSGGLASLVPQTADAVANVMLILLPDRYPLLLIPEDRYFGIGASLPGMSPDHPVRSAVEAAIRADAELSRVFNEHDEFGLAGYSTRSTGQGSGIQSVGFPVQQINNAWERAQLATDDPTFDDVAAAMLANLDAIRVAVRKAPATVPSCIGLTGVLLPDEVDVLDVGWGRVRRATEKERRRASLFGGGGQLRNTLPSGDTIEISYGGDLVLEADAPYTVDIGHPDNDAPWTGVGPLAHTRTAEWLESLRLGLALAIADLDEPMNVVPSWQTFIDPLGSIGNRSGWDTRQAAGIIPRQLSTTQAESWRVWSGHVQKHRRAEVNIAVRRMLMALTERRRPEDMLVDAVVVWENLFGASGETVFRISAALARLLATSAADRLAKQQDYKSIYTLRSDLVHGNVSKKINDVNLLAATARRAVRVSLDVLRTVFCDRADLLEIPNSSDRGLAVILGD